MSRLSPAFAQLKVRNESALICYITAGDPTADLTVEIIKAIVDGGADAIEIGIPFSDPMADGPSIQASTQRSLDKGMTTVKTLAAISEARKRCPNIPIVPMTYYNPVLCYGLEKFARDAAAAGVDGAIVTDLTPEEANPWAETAKKNGIDTVFLLAPTSTSERIEIVSKLSSGFIYCVSRTGVTGAKQDIPAELKNVVMTIKSHTDTPICVGFGISTPDHVRQISQFADGAVVGSALVDFIHNNRDSPDLLSKVKNVVASLKEATRLN